MSTTSPLRFSEGRMRWIGYLRFCSGPASGLNMVVASFNSLNSTTPTKRREEPTTRIKLALAHPSCNLGQRHSIGFKLGPVYPVVSLHRLSSARTTNSPHTGTEITTITEHEYYEFYRGHTGSKSRTIVSPEGSRTSRDQPSHSVTAHLSAYLSGK